MKNIFLTVTISIILLSSCGVNSTKKVDAHIHEDGTEHTNHDNSSVTTPKQELFEIENDTLSNENETLKNEHEKEHSHSHEDGHKH